MKQPDLEKLKEAVANSDPLDIVNAFIVAPADVPRLDNYWEHRLCCLAEIIVKQLKLKQLVEDKDLLEIGRQAVEDTLVEFRDSRIAQLRNNGLVIKEQNGEPSSAIRLGPEDCLRIGLKAIIKHLEEK